MTTDSTDVTATTPAKSSDIAGVVARVRKTFATGRTRDIEWRRQQLRALERLVTENEPAIADALAQDLGRKPFESWLADIASSPKPRAWSAGPWTSIPWRSDDGVYSSSGSGPGSMTPIRSRAKRFVLASSPPTNVSSISMMPRSIGRFLLQASRSRCTKNHADF